MNLLQQDLKHIEKDEDLSGGRTQKNRRNLFRAVGNI
jgi:hypothetical protein